MNNEELYAIVADDAPDRCQGVSKRGQCRFAAVKSQYGTLKYCPIHGGSTGARRLEREDTRRYRLALWQDRVNDFADDETIKGLGDEIGILRMVIEQVLLACHTGADLLLYSPKISDLVSKVEKLVVTLHKLETSSGALLTQGAAFALAGKIVDIVGAHVTDPDVVARIADEIGGALAGVSGSEPESLG